LPRWKTASVAAPEQTLEALVRDELRGPVSELVRRLVPDLVREELQLNGAAPTIAEMVETPSTKACTICKRVLPTSSFDRHRNQCKECRRDRERQRQAATASEDEPPGLPG
jgi:hypothetical protein